MIGYTAVGEMGRKKIKKGSTHGTLLQTRWPALHSKSRPSHRMLLLSFALRYSPPTTSQYSTNLPLSTHIWRPTVGLLHAQLLDLLVYLHIYWFFNNNKKNSVTLFVNFLFVKASQSFPTLWPKLCLRTHSPFIVNQTLGGANLYQVCVALKLHWLHFYGHQLGGMWPQREWAHIPGFLRELTQWSEG